MPRTSLWHAGEHARCQGTQAKPCELTRPLHIQPTQHAQPPPTRAPACRRGMLVLTLQSELDPRWWDQASAEGGAAQVESRAAWKWPCRRLQESGRDGSLEGRVHQERSPQTRLDQGEAACFLPFLHASRCWDVCRDMHITYIHTYIHGYGYVYICTFMYFCIPVYLYL